MEPKTGEVIPPPKRRKGRTHSLRNLLNDMANYRRAVDEGVISSADGQRRCAMVNLHAELVLNAVHLELVGAPVTADATPEEGYQAPKITPHRTKRVVVERGVDKLGQPIDKKVVAVTSSNAGDDELETAAEVEALT